MKPVELTWPQVRAFRLRRHHLDRRAARKDLARVVGDIGGAQAQVMSAAELQIAVRVKCSVEDVRDALWRDRTLVKTWLMRGTLHLASSEDLPAYIGAMSALWKSQMRQSWLDYMQTTEAEFWQIVEQVGAALKGEPMTREELAAIVGRGKSDHILGMLRSGWGSMLKPAARSGLLCFGPNRGQSVTFVRPERWLRSWRTVDRVEALATMARRYLRAYGPAAKTDFARWWGAWPGVGKAAWAALEDEVTTVSVEGARLELLTEDVAEIGKVRLDEPVQLIPAFDPYILGHASREHLFDKRFASLVSRSAGWISACVLLDGEVVGTWTHTLRNRALGITVAPFRRLTPAVAARVRERSGVIAEALGAEKVEVRFD